MRAMHPGSGRDAFGGAGGADEDADGHIDGVAGADKGAVQVEDQLRRAACPAIMVASPGYGVIAPPLVSRAASPASSIVRLRAVGASSRDGLACLIPRAETAGIDSGGLIKVN